MFIRKFDFRQVVIARPHDYLGNNKRSDLKVYTIPLYQTFNWFLRSFEFFVSASFCVVAARSRFRNGMVE